MNTNPTDLPLNTAIVVITAVTIVCLAWPKGILFKSRFGDVLDSRPPNNTKDPP